MDDTLKISSQVNQVHQFSAWSKDSEWAKPNGLIKASREVSLEFPLKTALRVGCLQLFTV